MSMIRVRVPGSSANLGPGFDCFGVAWQCYNEIYFKREGEGLLITGCPEEFQNEENLAWIGYRTVLERCGIKPDGVHIHFGPSEIPVCRGLGSSAALIVAGVAAANAVYGLGLSRDDLLDAGTVVEGHPDNIAPSLCGGLTASAMEGERAVTVHFPISGRLRFIGLIPDFELSTAKARAVLPEKVLRADAIYNVSRGALVLHALGNGEVDLLRTSMDDRIHQPYRWGLIDRGDVARRLALDCGAVSVCISGAGPTILCVAADDNFIKRMSMAAAKDLPGWEVRELPIDRMGVTCEEIEG
ncbi:MAG: homoserine kinase [Ruminococcaceae bacterium]|nr:homoserine kinase [Oscillospiraceae bacterium]